MNRKHFLIYYLNDVLAQTTPKDWARANYQHFPNYNFQGANIPTTETIEAYLIRECDYSKLENNEIRQRNIAEQQRHCCQKDEQPDRR